MGKSFEVISKRARSGDSVFARRWRTRLVLFEIAFAVAGAPGWYILKLCLRSYTSGKRLVAKSVGDMIAHRFWVQSVDFAPDGQHLASASLDGTALVWQIFGAVPVESQTANLESLWADLTKDGITAHRAMAVLIADKGTATFLRARVKPAVKPSHDRLKTWLAELGSSTFERREAAYAELARAGELIEPALRSALKVTVDMEVRRHLTDLLEGIARPETRPERLRDLRAIEVLERLGDADAGLVLRELSKGDPEACITREAKESLTRLRRR